MYMYIFFKYVYARKILVFLKNVLFAVLSDVSKKNLEKEKKQESKNGSIFNSYRLIMIQKK